MILLKLGAFVFITNLCGTAASSVFEWNDSNFGSSIIHHETVLTMFYAPWCDHCKLLKPELAKAAKKLNHNDPPVALAQVDCIGAGKETCNKFSIKNAPTLKLFRDGEATQDYKGPRTATGIIKYLQAQAGPSSKEFQNTADLEQFLNKTGGVIGFFENETELKEIFLNLSKSLRETIRFAHTSNKDILGTYSATDDVIFFRPKHFQNKFEDDHVKYEGNGSTDVLKDFIEKELRGLVGHRNSQNANQFKMPLIVAYYDVDYINNIKGTNYWRNRILKVAKNFADDFHFAISAKNDFLPEIKKLREDLVKTDNVIVIARYNKSKKYLMKKEFTMENFEEFLNDLKNGKLKPHTKSEPIPRDNDGPVKIAVSDNFDEIVLDNGKDTMVQFYAPWCYHCKELAPIYDQVGKMLVNEDVAIVKMDATKNEVPNAYDVNKYPTIYWLPKDRKNEPVSYVDDHELDAFIDFIAEHATDELKGYDREGIPKKTEL